MKTNITNPPPARVTTLLTGHIIPSSKFGYDKQTKEFSAFASDLTQFYFTANFGMSLIGRKQTGFMMKSSRTGRIITFLLREISSNENGIVCWSYECVEEDLSDLSAVIYND